MDIDSCQRLTWLHSYVEQKMRYRTNKDMVNETIYKYIDAEL